MKTIRTLGAMAAVLVAACIAGTAGAASRSNSQTFTDPIGDSGNAPDVTTVTVSNDDTGLITFRVVVPNRAQLADPDGVFVLLNTDGSLSNGMSGFDYVVVAVTPLWAYDVAVTAPSSPPAATPAPATPSTPPAAPAPVTFNGASVKRSFSARVS